MNTYMGINSTAGIPIRGKVNEDWEILMNTYATAYDGINGSFLMPHGGEKKLNPAQVRGRFLVLKLLAKKHCPRKMPFISRLETLTLGNMAGKINDAVFLREIRKLSSQNNVPHDTVNMVEAKVRMAEGMERKAPMNFGLSKKPHPHAMGNMAAFSFNPPQFFKPTKQKAPLMQPFKKGKKLVLMKQPIFPPVAKKQTPMHPVNLFFKQMKRGRR